MKKLALSIAIAAIAATSVQAKTVYSDDQMDLRITGELAFEVIRDADEDDAFEFKTDNVDLEVAPSYKLDNGMVVFGQMNFEFAGWTEEQDDVEVDDDVAEGFEPLKDHWVGVKVGGLEVRYGDQDYAIDDFGISEQKDSDKATVLGPDDAAGGSAEVIVVEYSADSYYIAASVDLPEKSKADDDTDATNYDLYAEVEIDDLTFGGVVAAQDQDGEDGDDAVMYYGASVEWKGVDSLKLAAEVTYNGEDEHMGFDTSFEYDISSDFDIGGGVGAIVYNEDVADYDTLVLWYVNADYDLHKDVDAYAEVYGNTSDEDGARGQEQVGFLVGISLDF